MVWQNELTELFDVKYPIIQAPMFGVTTPEMVAAASNCNCLGSLPIADLDAENSLKRIYKTKKLTNKPFVVNIFANDIPEITPELKQRYNATKDKLIELSHQQKFDVVFPEIEAVKPNGYKEQIDVILQEKCKILSFTFGNLDEDSINRLKEDIFPLLSNTNFTEIPRSISLLKLA